MASTDRSPHRPVDPRVSFPELEERVLERWRERDVFAESIRRRRDAPRWGFYEGPPTANGPPGIHHVLSRVFKDIFPATGRCAAYFVERKGGWDCHGLPVELAVEAELGFTSKDDIERFGIAEFNARCREKVLSHVEDWNRLTERIGFWIDLDDAYRTLDPDYVESVWWALKTIHDKGLLYEKLKVVPYCPRDQVTLSSHELGQPDVYRDVLDPSVYVRLPVIDPQPPAAGRRRAARLDDHALDAGLQRGRRRRPRAHLRPRTNRERDTLYVLAEARVERVLGEDADVARPIPRQRDRGRPLRAAVPLHPRRASTGRRATPSCRPTSSPPPTAPAWSTPRSPSARTTSASASSTG